MRKIILFAFLLLGFGGATLKGYSQSSGNKEVVSLSGAEIGVRSGVFYEQRLSRCFSLIGSVGYGVGTGATFHTGFSYTGVRPLLAIAPRWYFNIPHNNTLNNAPYIAFEISYSTETGAFLLPKDIYKREKWNLATRLNFGYRYSLSEKFLLKGEVGISLDYSKLHQKQGFFDPTDWKSKNEVIFDFGLIYKF